MKGHQMLIPSQASELGSVFGVEGIGEIRTCYMPVFAGFVDRATIQQVRAIVMAESHATGIFECTDVTAWSTIGGFEVIELTYMSTKSEEDCDSEAHRILETIRSCLLLVHALDEVLAEPLLERAIGVCRCSIVRDAAIDQLQSWQSSLIEDLDKGPCPEQLGLETSLKTKLKLVGVRLVKLMSEWPRGPARLRA